MQATLLKTNGTSIEVNLDTDNPFKNIREIIKGYVEVVKITGENKRVLLVNDEGNLKNLDLNKIASAYASQIIVGDAIIMERKYL